MPCLSQMMLGYPSLESCNLCMSGLQSCYPVWPWGPQKDGGHAREVLGVIFNGVLPKALQALCRCCLFSFKAVHLSFCSLGTLLGQLPLPGSPTWHAEPHQFPASSPPCVRLPHIRLCSPSVASRFAALAPLGTLTFGLSGSTQASLQRLEGSQTHT